MPSKLASLLPMTFSRPPRLAELMQEYQDRFGVEVQLGQKYSGQPEAMIPVLEKALQENRPLRDPRAESRDRLR